MKKFLSILITILMLMQMFTFSVSSEEAPAQVYWTGEHPGEVYFTFVSGVETYRVTVQKDGTTVYDVTKDFKKYDNYEGDTVSVRDVILENGRGTYVVGIGALPNGFGNAYYTTSDKYLYTEPTVALEPAQNIICDMTNYEVFWDSVQDAVEYDVNFGYVRDGAFCTITTYNVDTTEGYFNFYGDIENEIPYLEEQYTEWAQAEGISVSEIQSAVQIVAYPSDLNYAAPSYSDYVMFKYNGGETDGTLGYLKVEMPNVEFFPGDEFYSEVYVYTEDGNVYQVEDYKYEGFDSYTPGEQIVTIWYGNLSTTVNVWVYDEEEPSYSVYFENVKTEYQYGEDFYAEIYVATADGDYYQAECWDRLDGFDPYTIGEQTVTIWYQDYSAVYTVWVYADSTVTDYEIRFENAQIEYAYGEEFYVEVYLITAEGEMITVEDYQVEGFDPYTPGWQVVTVTYGDYSEAFKALVNEKEDDGNTSEFVENVYWSDELPGQLNFTLADGVDQYRIKLYKNDALISEITHSYSGSWLNNEVNHRFLEEICKNGSGTYRAEVAPDDGKDNYTASGDYVYKRPSSTLEKPQNVVLDRDAHCITWDEVPDAKYYEVKFGYSIDGGASFFMMSSTEILPEYEGCSYDMYDDLQWLEDNYIGKAESNGIAIDELIRAIQIVAYPTDLNYANVSYSDYVTFEALTIPDDEEPSYSVTFENVKNEYAYGEEFYIEVYQYTAEGEKVALEGWTVDGFDSTIAGEQEVTVSFGDYSETFVVYVNEKETEQIREVEIRRLKKQYYEGEEIEAEIWYETEDGRHEFAEDFEVEGYDAYFIGEQNVTISFGGYSEEFTVTVKPRPIIDENVTHIRIKNFKTLYYLGEEFEAEVYAYRDDGSCYMVEDYLYYDFDSSIIGEQSVMVRYGDFTDACIVCVYEEELTESLSGTCGANLIWTLEPNGVLTISGTGAMENYENTNGMPWYDHRCRIKEIIIEDGVTSIGKHAFAWCRSVECVGLPNTVTEIADYGFYACENLRDIRIPDGVTIGNYAFWQCARLENIDFGANVTIGNSVFCWCESLTNVNIHADTIIGECVFRYCESLENINVDDSNPYYCSIDGNLFNKDKTTLIQYAIGKNDESYEIPEGVTVIGEAAFDICTKLTSITIPNSVGIVEEYAFRGCKNLVDVYYNGTSSEFYSIVVNGNNEPLYDAAIHFIETPGPIYHVTFEDVKTVYNIGEEFYIEVYEYTAEGNKIELSGWTVDGFDSSVPGEQTVTVRYGDYEEVFVVYVDGEITPEPAEWEYDEENRELIIKFNGDMPTYQYDLNAGYTEAPWDYLRDEVEIISIWDGVTNISDGAFVRFTNLREVNMGSTVRRIGASVFEECGNLTYITIPDSVEYIGPRAFRASGLETLHFGENVRTIGSAAFMGSMLTRVELPESLGIIPSSVFASCKHLSEIYIPSSVHSIQPTAFNYCTELTDVYFDGTEEEWNNIAITSGNEPLYNANIYFNGEELTKTISIENVKTEYEYGEEFYAEIWIETSDGNRWQTYDFEVIDFDPYTVGWQTVIIRIEDREEPFDVYVRGDEVEEPYIVSVDFELLKDTYYRGEELKVYVYENMSDGTCNRVYDYEVVNFDSTRIGQQMVTINYKRFGEQFVIMVEERPASGGGGGGGSTATGPVITVSQEKGRVGNTVDVEVSISENTGFMNLGLEIEYDSGLKLVGVTEHNIGATFTGAQSLDVYPYNFNFSSTGDVAYNGTLVTLTFEIPEDAQAGDYFVGVDFYKGRDGNYIDGNNVNYDADENPLNLRYEDGFINVYNYIPGDINGNGVVDNKDGTALLRHLAGWTLEQIDYNALDVDGNGTVDNKDGTRLLRYLAGWDVEVY